MKKIIKYTIIILSAIMLIFSIYNKPTFDVSQYDLLVYKISNILISLSLLIPYIVINNKVLLRKLKLNKSSKILAYIIIFISMILFSNYTDSLHTEEYINELNYQEKIENNNNNNNNNEKENDNENIIEDKDKDNNKEDTNKEENNNIKIHYLDVGQGDSIFIELPNNKTMLIDSSENKYKDKIKKYIKNLKYNKIDYLIATHPHSDHIGSMSEIIKSFDIGSIYMPKKENNSKTYETLLNTIKNKNLKITEAKAGKEIINENNLKITILAPNSTYYKSLNNYSIVLKITYINRSFLFMGDAEKESEEEIKSDVRADVIKIGHHGSSSSSSLNFLKKVNPEYAIISVGNDNSYNHPHIETINTLNRLNIKTYQTNKNGTIIVTSNGNNLLLKKEK